MSGARDAGELGDVENSVSGGRQGIVIQGRDFNGPVTIYGDSTGPRQQPAHSAYWEHVRNIAPTRLHDREAELEELAAFCKGMGEHSFAWWRAGPWAGKSALLAWFALHPPEGVRVVPFFITARLAAQNDRGAFVEVVLEQLAELVGEPVPPQLTEATREAHLLRLFGRAARECRGRGERLVLIVDGLDEDRGVTDGPDAHSVAGLVARVPHDALRVVVAGRPNPPLPADVPDTHPLNRPDVVRELEPSSWAGAVRSSAEQELGRLFRAGGDHLDALGLLTAAGGGLSLDDLAQLTGSAPFRLQDVLRTASGRTFEVREGAYLLAHQELHLQARRLIGEATLGEYRERLHSWAAEYRERGWPPETPAYLLRGYFAMLREHGDVPRLVALAADPARHERLYGDTGGDVATLAEIRTGEEAIVEGGGQPLGDMLRLALQRDILRRRNAAVPRELPEAWAVLGYADRAEALARSMPSLGGQVWALIRVGNALRKRGDIGRAVEVLRHAEAAVLQKDHQGHEPWHFTPMVKTWLAWGELERAVALTASISSHGVLEKVVPLVSRALAEHGRYDEAETFAEAAERNYVRALGLLRAALAATEGGAPERAAELFRKADEAATRGGVYRSTRLLREMAKAYAELGEDERGLAFADRLQGGGQAAEPVAHAVRAEIALVLAGRGDVEHARTLVEGVGEASVRSLTHSADDLRMQIDTCLVLIATGDYDRAEAIAGTWPYDADRAKVALAMAQAGEADRALRLTAGCSPGFADGTGLSRDLCRALISHGRHDDAARTAQELIIRRASSGPVTLALAAAGQHGLALRLAEPWDGILPPEPVDLAWKCKVLLAVGQADAALSLATTIPAWTWRAVGLVAVARDLATGGRIKDAEAVLAQAESGYRDTTPLLSDLHERATAATALAGAGHSEQALALLHRIEQRLDLDLRRDLYHPSPRVAMPHAAVAQALAATRQFERVLRMRAAPLSHNSHTDRWLMAVIEELAAAGQPHLAQALVADLTLQRSRDRALSDLAKRHAGHGRFDTALDLAWSALAAVDLHVEAMAEIIEGLARDGQLEQARRHYQELMKAAGRNSLTRCGPQAAVARAAFALGDHATMTAMFDRAQEIGSYESYPGEFAGLTRALVATGQSDRAEAFVRGRTGVRDDEGSSLSGLIGALAEAGDIPRAEALAQAFPASPQATATACKALALALPPERATKAAALAVHHSNWITALPALLHADPSTLDVLTAPDVWPRLTAY
ncbi:hypothetical protein OG453_03130 [Streptomyces sp. NBC_01381]|uniref:tetratricopeptide repeat protein n=1 Tax=Streptomyces sp. NBC_01381 TaxID=2903845 RepID=UPI00224D9D95|nr:hypothetical protein [Streptomyces sp. NBC_01381]MCX4665675.1 hypothetical protein [Streptomyces sp. NBC_01381]